MSEHVLRPGSPREVGVTTGDRVVLRLPENPGTGFLWTVDETPATLTPAGDERVLATPLVPGAAGERVLTFDVTGRGQGTLRVSLRRPFNPSEVDSEERFEIVAASPDGG